MITLHVRATVNERGRITSRIKSTASSSAAISVSKSRDVLETLDLLLYDLSISTKKNDSNNVGETGIVENVRN